MGRASKYPDELRERAVRMIAEVRPQYPSQWAAITAVAGMLGIGTPETDRILLRPPIHLGDVGVADLAERRRRRDSEPLLPVQLPYDDARYG